MVMSRVFIVQEVVKANRETGRLESAMNFSPAMEFGTLETILPAGPVMRHPIPMVRELKKRLIDFGEDDHLLLVGDPVAIGAAVAVAASKTNGKVSTLRWDRRDRRYERVLLELT